MSDSFFSTEWRPKGRRLRRFIAKYLRWMVWGGYLFAAAASVGIVASFVIEIDQTIATTADAPGTVEATATPLAFEAPAYVLERRAADGSEVKAGQVVGLAAVGEQASALAAAAAALRQVDPTSPAAAELEAKILASDRRELVAPAAGVLWWATAEPAAEPLDGGAAVLRIADYSRLVAKGVLRGETVADASIGQTARVTSIDFNRDAKGLLRGNLSLEDSSHAVGSRRLFDGDAARLLAPYLKDRPTTIRNDRVFEFRDVALAEVEVDFTGGAGVGGDGAPFALDPSREHVLSAEVAGGLHRAKVQFRDLPAAAVDALTGLVRERLEGQTVEGPADGDPKTLEGTARIGEVRSVSAIIQAEVQSDAQPRSAANVADALPVASLDRYFEGELALNNPPRWLRDAVRANDAERIPVRAKLEIVTGRIPAALRLLKR